MTHKTCYMCKVELPANAEFFHRNKKAKDGLVNRCKSCASAYSQGYYRANTEYVLDRNKGWKDANPGKVLAQARQWAEENPEKRAQIYRKWRKENPEKISQYGSNRRAREKNKKGKITALDVADIVLKQGGKCFWCSREIGSVFHVDHVRPLSQGGENNIKNVVISCPSCNLSKSDKIPFVEWWPTLPLEGKLP